MKIVRNIFAGTMLVMFALSVVAGEGEKKKGNMPAFSDFDLDGDGTIVEQEFNEGHAKRFAERTAEGHKMQNAGKCKFADIDTDSDGGITSDEFSAHKAQHMNKGKHKCKNKEKCKHKHQHGQMNNDEGQNEEATKEQTT